MMERFIRSEDALLSAVSAGRTLHREHTEEGERFFLDDGRTVHANALRGPISRGELVPCHDDLFGGGARKHSADLPARDLK